MNPNQAISADENNVVELSESPGRRLRVQRQSRGLEVERVAAQLHLRPAMIEALEQDRYGDLPSPVFVAGYLRNYARLLGTDPAPLIAAYRAANPHCEPTLPRVSATARREIGSGHIVMRLISLAVLAGALGMLVLWWQNRADLLPDLLPGDDSATLAPPAQADASGEDSPASASSAGALPLGAPTLDAPPPAPTAALPADSEPMAEAPASAGAALAPTADEPPTPAPAPPVAAPESVAPPPAETPGEREVALAFSGPCWIDVRDNAGKSVLSGEMQKGDRHVLEGRPPYTFVIGNANSTAISIGGKPFDLGGVARGNVARFKLDPEGAQ